MGQPTSTMEAMSFVIPILQFLLLLYFIQLPQNRFYIWLTFQSGLSLPWMESPWMESPWVVLYPLMVFPVMGVAVALHELGHLWMGQGLGFHVCWVQVGWLNAVRHRKGFRLRFRRWGAFLGGTVWGTIQPHWTAETSRKRMVWFYLGGPLLTALLATTSWLLFEHSQGHVALLWGVFAVSNGLLLLGTLVPNPSSPNDGWNALQLWRNHDSPTEHLLWQLETHRQQGGNFADVEVAPLQAALQADPQGRFHLNLQYFLYVCFFRQQRWQEAEQLLDLLEKQARGAVAEGFRLDRVCLLAHVHHQPEAARALMAQPFRHARDFGPFMPLAEATLLLEEGKLQAALELVLRTRADIAADRFPLFQTAADFRLQELEEEAHRRLAQSPT